MTASKQLIENIVAKFSPNTFITEVESLVRDEELTYTEAIMQICEDSGIEPEDIAKMIDGPLKAKMAVEAERLHLIPRTTNTYSLFDKN